MSIEETLNERGKRYGDFRSFAVIVQGFKDIAFDTPGWKNMPPYQKEALELVFHKIGRMLNAVEGGYYDDNWRDCIGYCQLVLAHLEELQEENNIEVPHA
jgi:hypothetical protein